MKRKTKTQTKRLPLIRIALVVLFLVLAFFLRLASLGLPATWVDAMAQAASTEQFALEMERVSVSFRRGELDIGRIQIFPRGYISDAVIEMASTSVKLRLWRNTAAHPLSWLQSIRVRRIIITEAILNASAPTFDADRSDILPAFGPVLLQCAQADVLGATGRRIEAQLTSANGSLAFTEVSGSFTHHHENAQRISGKIAFGLAPFTMIASGSGKLDPVWLIPIFKALDLHEIADEIKLFDFPDFPPDVTVNAQYDPTNQERNLILNLTTGHCVYSGIPLTTAQGTLRASGTTNWNRVEISPVSAVRPEGMITGALDIRPQEKLLSFEAESTIDLLHVLRIIRITDEPVSLPLTFDNPTRLVASGVVDLAPTRTRTELNGTLTSPRISSYGIHFENATAQCHLTDFAWTITQSTASVLGGHYSGTTVFTPSPSNVTDVVLSSQGILSGLNHAEWSTLMNGTPSDSPGKMNLNYMLTGKVSTNTLEFLNSLKGSCEFAVRDTQLYRVPLFAGLTSFIASTIPGVDFVLSQDILESSLTFANGILDIHHLDIRGNVFSASGHGTLTMDGQVDLRVKAHLLNRQTWVGQSLYYLLFPISKIFELRATGSVQSPRWSSATLSTHR